MNCWQGRTLSGSDRWIVSVRQHATRAARWAEESRVSVMGCGLAEVKEGVIWPDFGVPRSSREASVNFLQFLIFFRRQSRLVQARSETMRRLRFAVLLFVLSIAMMAGLGRNCVGASLPEVDEVLQRLIQRSQSDNPIQPHGA